MKPKELLYSLDHVGEDLLAGAEQTVLVRKRRPWAGAAAAAVVLVALGVGGFFLWRNLRGGVNPAATGEPGGTTAVHVPTDEPDPPSTEPDRLNLGDCWTGLSRARFDDLDCSLAGSLAADYEGLTSLPVYEREAGPLGDFDHLYTDEELQNRLRRAADALGLRLTGDVVEGQDDRNGYPDFLKIQTDQGELTVSGDGRITLFYDEDHVYEARVKVALEGGLTQEETERAIRDAQMTDCGETLAERLGLGACGFVTCDRWDLTSSAWTVFTVYPLRENPADRLISRWFERVQMLTNDGKTLRGFVLDRLPGETDAEAPEGLRLVGTYPIRTAEEAVEALLRGSGLCEEALVQNDLNGATPAATLIWLPDSGHKLLMPFYRFWVPANADCDEYLAVYIPAVVGACLADWSEPAEDPAEHTESCFERITDSDRDYFTDGTREIWLENGTVWIKDLTTGETECLLELKQAEDVETELVGVTAQRLYFGWNYADDWWGQNVYSINYRGLDLRDLGTGLGVTFRDGWLILDSFRTDVSPVSLRIIDRNDQTVVDVKECWSWAEADGSCWYIYPPALQDTEALDAMSQDERAALLENLRYDLCRLDPDGSITVVGSVERDYYGAYFQIDLEHRCVRCFMGDEDGELLDLYTLLPVREAPVPDDPEPTEAPDGYQPTLTGQPGDPTVTGPAGTVKALHYMGDCQSPVWADLDGDGFRELIYWCYGPTSGIFTAGICVYGLEEGWPVVRGFQLYSMRFGELSLSEQDGSVFLHYTPRQYSADTDSSVLGEAQLLAVTLKNGKILLNGSAAVEGITEWGGSEWGWFGSSFDVLKAEVRDRCVLNHWACLVWTVPSAASAPTAGPRVFAAVTDNSTTVTGLLRYEPQQDGTWFCAMQGIEPIEAPDDPQALMGLTMEELAARLGPCHFDMGSGFYIPCWFTEDCRLLIVYMQDVANYVELKPLTALGD